MTNNFKVPLTRILNVQDHPNADRLSIYTVYGFQIIGRKGQYRINDLVIYCPVDSILSESLETKLFPVGSKITLTKRRVRQIKLRGVASQGMLIPPSDLPPGIAAGLDTVETDYGPALGITKFEPPQREVQVQGTPGKPRQKENPDFNKYGSLNNIKWFPDKFKADEMVVIQEKIHGSNGRAGIFKTAKPKLKDLLLAIRHLDMKNIVFQVKKHLLNLLGKLPATEFCYGSNNTQQGRVTLIQNRPSYTGFYGMDIWSQAFSKLEVQNKLRFGETIFGEVYGEGVQKGYSYGTQEKKFVLFDVTIMQQDGTHRWLNPDEVKAFAQERGFDMVPELYRGPYQSLDFVKSFAKGDSVFVPSQKVREGVVVKSLDNYNEGESNRALKIISEDYLADDTNTDFH